MSNAAYARPDITILVISIELPFVTYTMTNDRMQEPRRPFRAYDQSDVITCMELKAGHKYLVHQSIDFGGRTHWDSAELIPQHLPYVAPATNPLLQF
jgi:hypothetical protein